MKPVCITNCFFVKRIISGITLPTLVVIACVLSLPAQPFQQTEHLHAPVNYSSLAYITPAGEFFYFTLNDDRYGLELWRSDGTAAGTYRVKDISPGPSSASPENFVMVCGVLYFTANDGAHGRELWRSDGTAEGTVMVKDILPGADPSRPQLASSSSNTLFFQAENEAGDLLLWSSDGTADGTIVIADASMETTSFYPDYYTALNGTIDLRKETKMMRERNHALESRSLSAQAMSPMDEIAVNGLLLFTADQPEYGRELWRSDGTVAGTFMVRDIAAGTASSYGVSTADNMVVLKDHLYFLAQDEHHGTELWRSDGTSNGTVLVKDIVAGSGTSSIRSLTSINRYLYFSAHDGVHGSEVWRSDGTAVGTSLLKDVAPGAQSSDPRNFTAFHNDVYFSVLGAEGVELWKTDGTAGGTSKVFPQNAPVVMVD